MDRRKLQSCSTGKEQSIRWSKCALRERKGNPSPDRNYDFNPSPDRNYDHDYNDDDGKGTDHDCIALHCIEGTKRESLS